MFEIAGVSGSKRCFVRQGDGRDLRVQWADWTADALAGRQNLSVAASGIQVEAENLTREIFGDHAVNRLSQGSLFPS